MGQFIIVEIYVRVSRFNSTKSLSITSLRIYLEENNKNNKTSYIKCLICLLQSVEYIDE